MIIKIKTDKHRMWLPVPLFALRLIRFFPGELSAETEIDVKAVSRELHLALKQARRDFRGMELVHVRSAEGEEVIIKL